MGHLQRLTFQQKLILEHVNAGHDLKLANVRRTIAVAFQKRLKAVRGLANDLDHQIKAARHPEDVHDLVALRQPLGDLAWGVRGSHADPQHRVRLVLDGHRVHQGHNFQQARLLHALDAVADGAFGNLERLGDVLVRKPPVVLQHPDDLLVEFIMRRITHRSVGIEIAWDGVLLDVCD